MLQKREEQEERDISSVLRFAQHVKLWNVIVIYVYLLCVGH